MLRDRGYQGSPRALRRFVKTVRPVSKREAFLRLDALIGEQAQVDWAHVRVGNHWLVWQASRRNQHSGR
jgi:transposase